MTRLRPFALLTLPLLILPLAPSLAQETAAPAATEAADPATALPEMTAIEQAYQTGDYVFAREGLQRLATEAGTALAQYRYGRILLEGRGGPRDVVTAAEWLQRAVDQEYLAAATLLARVYLSGDGVDRDPERAAALLAQAAARGDSEAQYYLGLLYRAGEGVPQSMDEAFNWFLAAAEQQNIEAQYELSRAYSRGEGTALDIEKALHWLQEAAISGHVLAQVFLANALDSGQGVEQNRAEALRWYTRAAEAGNPLAQRVLGTKYLLGDGVDKNTDEALRWLHPAAEAGDPGAQHNLGLLYSSGTGLEQNAAQAALWFSRAAKAGVPRSMLALGQLYEQGNGVDQDLAQAVALYRQAAGQGLAGASLKLGQLVGSDALDGLVAPQHAVPWAVAAAQDGDSGALNWLIRQSGAGIRQAKTGLAVLYLDQDDRLDEAVALLEHAAVAGETQAQFRLGELYATGKGVSQDYVTAHKWLNVAAAQGNEAAAESRDIIAQLMTPDQVAEAQAAARAHFEADAARAPATQQTIQVSE